MVTNNIKKIVWVIKRLKYVLKNQHKGQVIKVVIVMVVSTFLELLGVSAILPFVEAVTEPDNLMKKPYIIFLCSMLNIRNSKEVLLMAGLAIILIYVFKNLFMMYAYYIQYDFSSKVSMDLSLEMLDAFLKRPYEFFLNVNSSEVLRGCISDVVGIYTILYSLISLATETLSICIIGIYLIYTDPWIAISVIFLLILILCGMFFVFKPIFKKIGKKYLEVATRKTKEVFQITSGIKDIYVNQRKNIFRDRYATAVNEERKINRIRETLSQCPDRIIEGVCVSGIIGIICIRLMFQDESIITFIPKLAVFAMAAFKVFPSVGKITTRLNTIVFQIPALDNVYENIKESEEYEKNQSDYIQKYGTLSETTNAICFQNKISIQNIAWKYCDQKQFVLSNVSLEIYKGQSVGIIGSSGSGKTTLTDIILGLLIPQQGTVLMDGIDIYTIPQQWAKIVGYVPQSIFLMDDTVRNNILFGLCDENDDRIWSALEKAQLKSFIELLPKGLDTIVGERGVKFSGGQRQRIAIARALYREPEILVLDEATAALDNETEAAVMEAVESLQGKVTLIIIAHRLSTIKNCDVVYEMKGGEATKKENVNFCDN